MADTRLRDLTNQPVWDASASFAIDDAAYDDMREIAASVFDARFVEVAGDTMTGALTINVNSATALLVEQDGVKDNVLLVDTATPDVTINGAFYVQGATVFNEAQLDVDFRIESDISSNMLFLDAGNNRVGIGTGAPLATLHVLQYSATGAQATLRLQQEDYDQHFIQFQGDAANAILNYNLVDVGDVSTFTVVGYLKIYIQDDGNQITDGSYYIAFGTLA